MYPGFRYVANSILDGFVSKFDMQFFESRVLIRDFYREQAWEERWTKKSENNIGHNRKEVLALMHNVAKAETADLLPGGINQVEESNAYKSNPKLQK